MHVRDRRRHLLHQLLGSALLVIGAACGDSGGFLVDQPRIGEIRLEPASLDLELHESIQLEATPISTEGARLQGFQLRFSSMDPEVASVSVDGMVKGLRPGETSVEVESGGKRVLAPVRVWAPLHEIRMDPPEAAPIVGETLQLRAIAYDEFGSEMEGRRFIWSSSRSEIAEVDEDGLLRAVRAGPVVITASAGGRSGISEVNVRPGVAQVVIDPPVDEVRIGNRTFLRATVTDSRGRILEDREVIWTSSQPEVASVDPSGVVSGLAVGRDVEITAVAGGVSGSAMVSVLDVAVARIEITPSDPLIFTGDERQLTATLYDKDDNVLLGREVKWEIRDVNKIAAIDPAGQVTALRPGQVTVHVSADKMNGTATVSVLLRLATISAGRGHSCGLSPVGQAWCWGSNEDGQLGHLAPGANETSYAALPVETELNFASISAGGWHSCALTAEGVAYCWGRNEHGQLGNNSTIESMRPVAVELGLRFDSIYTGLESSCALDPGGEAWCWGRGGEWQQGSDGMEDQRVPERAALGLRFTSMSLGHHFACGIDRDGAAWCWGYNLYGLGSDRWVQSPIPIAVEGGLVFETIEAGEDQICGLTRAGEAWCWGDNSSGQLGNDRIAGSANLPEYLFERLGYHSRIPVPVLGGHAFHSLAAGGGEACAVDLDDALWCWGRNIAGGPPVARQPSPRELGIAGVRSISMGLTHSCAITDGGITYCWGFNTSGEVGQPVGSDGNYVESPLRLFPEEVVTR